MLCGIFKALGDCDLAQAAAISPIINPSVGRPWATCTRFKVLEQHLLNLPSEARVSGLLSSGRDWQHKDEAQLSPE